MIDKTNLEDTRNPSLIGTRTSLNLKGFRSFAANEIILHKGEGSDQIFLILEGSVKVSSYSISGKEVWHSVLKAGTFFGDIAALTGSKRSATVTAMEASKVNILSKKNFLDLVRDDPEIAIWLLSEMAERLRVTTQTLAAQVAQSNSQRIRVELVNLARPDPSEGHLYSIKPKPKILEMAQRLNTDRENVSREISSLIKLGVIEKKSEGFIIRNLEFLKQSSEI